MPAHAIPSPPAAVWRRDVAAIVALAWPVLLGQLAVIAFGVIDTAMVARASASELAALGLGGAIYISVYVGLMGVLQALSPVAAQLFGAGRDAEIGEAARQGLWLALLLTIPGMALLCFPGPLLELADVPSALQEQTAAYLRMLGYGLPAALGFRVYMALNNAVSRPLMVTLIQIAGLALKIPLNLLLIFGAGVVPAMGGPGCGLASTLVNWLSLLAGIIVLRRDPFYRRFALFSTFSPPRPRRLLELLRLGVPMGASYLIEVTSFALMALFIARLGTTTLAGHQITANFGTVLYMLPLSLAIATSTLVGQAIGADRVHDARRLGWTGIAFGSLCAATVGMLTWLGRHLLIAAYTPDPAVAAAALPLYFFIAFYQLFDALQVVTAFVLRAYKIALVPMAIYAISLWGVGLGGGVLLGLVWRARLPAAISGAAGFWLANSISLALAALGLMRLFSVVSRRSLAHAT